MADDLHIVKQELFDVDIMDEMLRDTVNFSKTDLNRLKTYKKHRLHGNVVQVVYHFGTGMETTKLGRLYAKNNLGLQGFPRDIRNPLLEKHYWDIDIENCHYNLMLSLGTEYNIRTDNIKYYCEHRDECLDKVSLNRRVSKTAFLKVAFGGNVKLHDENYIDDGIAPDGDVSILENIKKEVDALTDMCYIRNAHLHKIVSRKEHKKASLFALILQTEERKCLLALDNYLKTKNRQADILIHDGLEVRKLDGEISFPEELLIGGEKYIFDHTKHRVHLVNKPFEHNYRKKEEEHTVIDDVYAAKVFIKLMGDFVVRDGEDVYFFNEQNGLWENSDVAFRIAVTKHKAKLIFIDRETNKKVNYGGIEKNVSAMRKWIVSSLPDTNYITRNINSGMGKLLFADGIYDFVTDIFTEGFNPKIIFFKRIARKFPKERNEELIAMVNTTLFVSAFDYGDGLLAGEYLKKVLVMGIFGDYTRKKFYVSQGNTSSGKGLLVSALRQAFEEYIDEYDANNLLYQPNSTGDEAKKLAWVKDVQNCRLCFSNEIRLSAANTGGLDGNLIKTLSSGGDSMKIRGLFENQKNYVNRATMAIMCNDIPSVTPSDSAIKSRMSFIKYQLRFVDDPKEDDERLADPSVKFKFHQDEYKDAIIHLFIKTYKEMDEKEKCVGGHVFEPPCVQAESSNWIQDDNKVFLESINMAYEITNNPEDTVETKMIVDYIINDCKLRMSATKLNTLLNKMIKLDKKDCIRNKKKCKMGIKIAVPTKE